LGDALSQRTLAYEEVPLGDALSQRTLAYEEVPLGDALSQRPQAASRRIPLGGRSE